MQAATPVTTVHSVAEAYLYLMVRPCPDCGDGPLQARGELTRNSPAPGGWSLEIACAKCRHAGTLQFAIEPEPTRSEATSNCINPTPLRSEAIDLLGWLTLYRSIIESARKQSEPAEMRRLAGEAAQCLDEALKFYALDNELPPPGAFFSEASSQRFRDHPQQFARSRWLHERSRLPGTGIATKPAGRQTGRGWWQFWKRGT